MKVYKPNTDCEVNLAVIVNGQQCPEFVLPDAEDDPTVATCFIPITDNDTITVQGTFSGSVLQSRVDVLADGSFVTNRIIEGERSKEGVITQFNERRVEIKTFLHVPDVTDHKPGLRPKVVEGNLVTKRLPAALHKAGQLSGDDEAAGVGVGSLILVVSLNQTAFEKYGEDGESAYSDITLGSWRGRVADVKNSGIVPEHELEMEVFPRSNPVTDKRATLFWRDLKANRPGEAPWAYLIFYYRTQAAIDAAGCIPRTETKMLPPDNGTFTSASDQSIIPHKDTGPSSPSPAPVAKASSIATSTLPVSQPKKNLGLGRPLLLYDDQGISQQHSNPVNENEKMASRDKKTVLIGGPRAKVGGTFSPAQRMQSPGSSPSTEPSSGFNSRLSFTSSLFPQPSRNADAASTSSAKPSVEDGFEDLASPSRLNYRRPPMASKSKQTTNAAPPSGSRLPSPSNQATTLLLPDKVTTAEHIKSQSMPRYPQTSEADHTNSATEQLKQHTQSPKPSQPPSISSKQNKHSCQELSTKRSISQIDEDVSDSTPVSNATSTPASKRTRLERMAARKAEMEAALQAKRERVTEKQKNIEDAKREREKKLRQWEEEEETRREEAALEAEMEALQQGLDAEDDLVAKLEEEEENELMAWEELRRARGGEQ